MIYADENVWMPVVEGLRRRGWDVATAVEEGTLGEADVAHLEYATDRGWPLLTFDDDFLSLVEERADEFEHAGMKFVSQHGRDVSELVQRIDHRLSASESEDLTETIVYA